MSATPDLATMLALLQQARAPARLSLGLLLAALLLLGLQPQLTMTGASLLLFSIAAGLAQTYFALRVNLDRALLRMLLDEGLSGDAAARRVDQALEASKLRAPASTTEPRGWDSRWQGMRRLLLRQTLCVFLQLLVLLSAVLWRLF
ncbi:MAG: hypothetical protein LBG66_06095 [Gallionellaceae bacterium]|jgi:hypothetical protein|nr:hypothetical protein [Gallionellaceae bacterium]